MQYTQQQRLAPEAPDESTLYSPIIGRRHPPHVALLLCIVCRTCGVLRTCWHGAHNLSLRSNYIRQGGSFLFHALSVRSSVRFSWNLAQMFRITCRKLLSFEGSSLEIKIQGWFRWINWNRLHLRESVRLTLFSVSTKTSCKMHAHTMTNNGK